MLSEVLSGVPKHKVSYRGRARVCVCVCVCVCVWKVFMSLNKNKVMNQSVDENEPEAHRNLILYFS